MKKSFQPIVLTLGLALTTGLILAGCAGTKTDSTPSNSTTQQIEQKKGDTTLKGTLTKVGEQYTLTSAGQPPKSLDSYKIDLSQYVGKQVKVTGQYSGDTLFVSLIE